MEVMLWTVSPKHKNVGNTIIGFVFLREPEDPWSAGFTMTIQFTDFLTVNLLLDFSEPVSM